MVRVERQPTTDCQTSSSISLGTNDKFEEWNNGQPVRYHGYVRHRAPFTNQQRTGHCLSHDQQYYGEDSELGDIEIPISWSSKEGLGQSLSTGECSTNDSHPTEDESMKGYWPNDIDPYMLSQIFMDYSGDVIDSDEEGTHLAADQWIPDLHLNMSDKRDLEKQRMLSDKHMYAAQILLRRQFPHVGGLQDTILAQTGFQPVHVEGIQIHHIRGNHWVLSSSIGGRVVVYDSIYNDITPELQKQLNEIYTSCPKNRSGDVITEMSDVFKQTGSKDCGLVCIAIAFELCCGEDLASIEFDQETMRQHLMDCFMRRQLMAFPRFKQSAYFFVDL